MREIKFRAWDKKTNDMILVLSLDFLFESEKGIRAEGACNCNGGFTQDHEPHKHEVFPEDLILMQFTGLLDKNGKKIFEGDVVEDGTIVDDYGKPFRGLIGFETSAFRLIKTNCDCGECLNSVLISGNELIVIGNLYESPELLNTNRQSDV